MTKCAKCGKKIGIFEQYKVFYKKNGDPDLPTYYCLNCYEQNFIEEEKELLEKKIIEERLKKTENLPKPEAELLAMIHDLNKEQKVILSNIEQNVQTITSIMIIYFILFLISLIITIMSVIALL